MGEVYRARDARLGREVAVKVIAAESATDPDRLARFEQEARAAAALNHPSILAVFDIGPGSPAHGPYIVSELLEGETLAGGWRAASCRCGPRWRSASRSPGRSPRRTTRASCTGIARGSSPRLATDERIVYALDGELWSAAFDAATLTIGVPRRVGVTVMTNAGGLANFAVAGETLAVADGGSNLRQLVIYDRAGRRQVLTDPPRRFFSNAVPSPDGTLIAAGLNDTSGAKIVEYDLARNVLSTAFEALPVSYVEWAPGGRLLAYESGANALRTLVPGTETVSPPLFA